MAEKTLTEGLSDLQHRVFIRKELDMSIRTRREWQEYLIDNGWIYKPGGWWMQQELVICSSVRMEYAIRLQHNHEQRVMEREFRKQHPGEFDKSWGSWRGVYGSAGI